MKKKRHGVLEEELSEERTLLSNERTLLSYVRTAFAVIVAGIALLGFFREGTANILGFVVLFVGILFLIFGIIYYFNRKKKIIKGELELSLF
jgi:putative membrane protein